MSLPPALLQRLAQRGLVQKQKQKQKKADSTPAENEEVIAEDYDEMDAGEHNGPEDYDHIGAETHKRTEENFWLERMKARMAETGSSAGYKGCPNKYNIWHKCTLFCVTRWADGHLEPSREYMRRYKRLLRKYPLPKGWTAMYDPGCGCFYFHSAADNVVSWLPPTHPKSQVSKTAAAFRRQMEEANGEGAGGSDGEDETADDDEEEQESGEVRHQREIDEIISSSMRSRSPPITFAPQNFPNLQEVTLPPRKQKSRDLDRALSRQRRDRHRNSERERHSTNGRRRGRDDSDVLDPMDPSAYSDIPRGKWSDGLHIGGSEERKKSSGDERKKTGSDERKKTGSDERKKSGGDERKKSGNDERKKSGSDERKKSGSAEESKDRNGAAGATTRDRREPRSDHDDERDYR